MSKTFLKMPGKCSGKFLERLENNLGKLWTFPEHAQEVYGKCPEIFQLKCPWKIPGHFWASYKKHTDGKSRETQMCAWTCLHAYQPGKFSEIVRLISRDVLDCFRKKSGNVPEMF